MIVLSYRLLLRYITMHLPTIKQLRYLVALSETEHFGRAAEACFVSQPTFSIAIKELESILKVQLFDRTNKSVTITTIGKRIIQQAQLCLRDAEGLLEIAQDYQSPLTGMLKMGVIPTVAPFLLPKVLPAIRKNFPNLELYFKEDQSENIYHQLMSGQLDILLLALPYEMKNTEQLVLFQDKFMLASKTKSKLVDPDNYKFSQLDSESILLLEEGHCLRDHALSACKLRKPEKISRFSATSLFTLVQMVESDLGITFLPEMARGSALLRGTKIKLTELQENSYREIGLVWRKGSARSEEFKELAKYIHL